MWINHSFWLSFDRPCSDCQQKLDYLHIQILSWWVFESLDSKNKQTNTCNYLIWFNTHMKLGFNVQFQSDFYRCIWLWMLWSLKSDFKLSFASLFIDTQHQNRWWKCQKYPYCIRKALFLVRQRSFTPRLDRVLIWRSRWCTSTFPASVLKASSHMCIRLRCYQSNPCR